MRQVCQDGMLPGNEKAFGPCGTKSHPLLTKEIKRALSGVAGFSFQLFLLERRAIFTKGRVIFMSKISPKTLRLVYCAVFLAIGVVLSFLAFYLTEDIKVSFAPVAVMMAGAVLGPLAGAAVGALTDILVLLIKSLPYPYFPGFTITMALYGLLAGLFFYHRKERSRRDPVWYIAVGVAVIQTVCSLLINSMWNNILYGPSYGVVLLTRAPMTYIMCAMYIVILAVLVRSKQKMFKTLYA